MPPPAGELELAICAPTTFGTPRATNLGRAGVDTTTAMRIVGHKSEQMHRRYNTIEPEDLHAAAAKLQAYTANSLITVADSPALGHSVSVGIQASGRSAAW